MAQARGNNAIITAMLLFCMVVFYFEIAHAKTFEVGDARGWDFGVSNWPSGKTFKAGDILVFNYNTAAQNVAVVNAAEYNSCTAPSDKTFDSGQEKIKLTKGLNYFICAIRTQCEAGMKMVVNAQ